MIVRFIVSSVAGGIVFFILGFLIYGMALFNFMQANTVQYEGLIKDPPNFIALAIANIVWGAMIAFVTDYWAGASTWAGGAKVGAILMFFAVLALDVQFVAFMNMYKGATVVIVDVIGVTVMGAVAGAVIGFIIGKMKGSEA